MTTQSEDVPRFTTARSHELADMKELGRSALNNPRKSAIKLDRTKIN